MRAASSQVFTSKEPCFSPSYCDLQIHVISPVQEQVLNKSHPHTQGLPGYLRYFLHLQPGKGRPLSPLTLVFWDIRSRGSEPQRLPVVCTKETYDKAVETHWFHHSRSMVFHWFLMFKMHGCTFIEDSVPCRKTFWHDLGMTSGPQRLQW